MSKIRTLNELVDETDQDLAWRRTELSELRSLSNFNKGAKSIRRCLIALTYAHWEGYVKSATQKYIEFVKMQGLKNQELASNFLTLALYPMLSKAGQSKQFNDRHEIVLFFKSNMDSRSKIPNDIVDTKSNLSYKVFENIVEQLGLDITHFESKKNLIDTQLIARRNMIAHGEYMSEELEDIYSLIDTVISLMDIFRNLIQNAAINESYKANLTP